MATKRDTDVDVNITSTNITNYFRTTKSPIKGFKANKTCQLDTSSVYLTPESSPSKDKLELCNGEKGGDGLTVEAKTIKSPCAKALHNTYTCDHMTLNREGDKTTHDGSSNLLGNGNSIEEPRTFEEITHIPATSEDGTENADEKSCALDDTIHIEELEKPVLSHSPICNAYGTRPKYVEKGNSSETSGAVSSPCLPRTKVRKGAPLKKDLVTMDSTLTTEPPQMKPKPGRRKKKEPVPVQSSTIPDFFPVRRSGRQTKREIEQQKHQLLEKLISSNCEDGLEVKNFDDKGRGIIANKQFDKGDFVIEYAGDLIDTTAAKQREDKYSEKPEIGCYMYYFVHGDRQYCVDATLESGRMGRLINHSRDGNCCTKVVSFKNGPRLILVAARDIKVGEELSYDYGDRRKSSIDAHPWLKL